MATTLVPPRPAPPAPPGDRRRRRRRALTLAPVIVLAITALPVVLLAGAGNPPNPCGTGAGASGVTTTPGGTSNGGLNPQAGKTVAMAAYTAGWRGNDLVEMTAVAYAESGWNPTVGNGSHEGLWEDTVTSSTGDLSDPDQNAEVAHTLWTQHLQTSPQGISGGPDPTPGPFTGQAPVINDTDTLDGGLPLNIPEEPWQDWPPSPSNNGYQQAIAYLNAHIGRWGLPAGWATETTKGAAPSGTGNLLGQSPNSTSTTPAQAQVSVDSQAADAAAAKAPAGEQVGWAVVTPTGQVIAQQNGNAAVYGASITKAMLLVAEMEKLGSTPVPASEKALLEPMIEVSDNQSGSEVFSQVGASAVEHVAHQAGMTGFQLDTSDPEYTLGQSKVTALDQARLFAQIDQLIPATNRSYAMGLLSSISTADHWGILSAQLGGTSITASKAGWKPEGAGWVVNQGAQLQVGGQTVGLAITTSGDPSQADGEQMLQDVTTALDPTGGADSETGCQADTSDLTTVNGPTAQIQSDGSAAAPANAPQDVKQAIAAGNQLIHTFYSQERRPNMLTQLQDSYDCSGSSDFVLTAAGLGNSPLVDVGDGIAGDSSLLMSYGTPASGSLADAPQGHWITVYGSTGHAFLVIAGLMLDTSWGDYPVVPATVPAHETPGDSYPFYGGPASGPRWLPISQLPRQLADGENWVARYPQGAAS